MKGNSFILFFLLCAPAGEEVVVDGVDPSSSSLGSVFTSGFLSSPDDVSMVLPFPPSPDGSSFFTLMGKFKLQS